MITGIAHIVFPLDRSRVLSKTNLATGKEDQDHCGYPQNRR